MSEREVFDEYRRHRSAELWLELRRMESVVVQLWALAGLAFLMGMAVGAVMR